MTKPKEQIQGMLVCELCSRSYTPEAFYNHLKEHTKEERSLLMELLEITKKMTPEEYNDFITSVEIEVYREAQKLRRESSSDSSF